MMLMQQIYKLMTLDNNTNNKKNNNNIELTFQRKYHALEIINFSGVSDDRSLL